MPIFFLLALLVKIQLVINKNIINPLKLHKHCLQVHSISLNFLQLRLHGCGVQFRYSNLKL